MEYMFVKSINVNNTQQLHSTNNSMVKYIENYALYQEIGSGVYGKVFRAVNNTDKKEYAIKVIPISKFRQNKKLEECTVNEINILTNMEAHKHIIRYYDMLKTTNNFYFIYQYCNGGTLDNLIAKQGKLAESKALLIFKQLIEAFQVLNKYNIMHRDMKPDNIFFHNGVIKLGDFGFCKNLNSADEMTKTMLGSPIYMAPEVLKGQIYSNKADIWSLGVVLYQMIFGHCPFQSNSIAKLIEVLNSKQLQFPGQISPYVKNIISRMLTKDPNQRIGWMQLFQIKISPEGCVESQQHYHKINSLQQAKPSSQINQMATSSKNLLPRDNRQNIREQSSNKNTNFKKNKSPSPYTQNSIASTNTSPNYTKIANNTTYNDPELNNSASEYKTLGKQHSIILEGVKLAMEIVQSKMPNNMGYGYLILTRVIKVISDMLPKYTNLQLRNILETELKDSKSELQSITSKMFAYQLKGIQDWKKYLRGKFFEEQKTIHIWFKMINYLNGSNTNTNAMTYKTMVEIIKNILY